MKDFQKEFLMCVCHTCVASVSVKIKAIFLCSFICCNECSVFHWKAEDIPTQGHSAPSANMLTLEWHPWSPAGYLMAEAPGLIRSLHIFLTDGCL